MSTAEKVKQITPSATLYVRCCSKLMRTNEYVVIAGLKELGAGRTRKIAWANALYGLIN